MSNEAKIKAILYRSNYRGCKETDILLGRFANSEVKNFDDGELNLYEKFIAEDDAMIYDWILKKTPTPENYQNLVNNIRQFHDL
jgi:antitoxin CptB